MASTRVGGSEAAKRSNASAPTLVPVGLFGLHTKTSLVRGVTARASAGRSCTRSAPSGTRTERAPMPWTTIGYIANEGQANTHSSPGPSNTLASSSRISSAPAPNTSWEPSTPSLAASARRRCQLEPSG